MNIYFSVITVIGTVGILIYGIRFITDGFQNILGERLRSLLKKVSSNLTVGIGAGALFTAIVQSSTAVSVMVVSFVSSGVMNIYDAVSIIFGANIGTTITTQIVAHENTYVTSIVLLLTTFTIIFYESKNKKEIEKILIGFSMLFISMQIMKSEINILSGFDQFKSIFMTIGSNAFVEIIIGMLITAILKSSSASIAILIAVSNTGILPLNMSMPILLGNNIGSCISALFAADGASKTAQKTALIHLNLNVTGVIIFEFIILPFTPFIDFIKWLTPGNFGVQIANAHTFFNILNVFLQAPFIKYIIAFSDKVIKGEDNIEKPGAKFIDNRLIDTPITAVEQTFKEVLRMGDKVKENFRISIEAFKNDNNELIEIVYENEKIIDILEKEITEFMIKLSNSGISYKQSLSINSFLRIIKDLKRASDDVKSIADLASEKMQKSLNISKDYLKDLLSMYDLSYKAFEMSMESFRVNDSLKANDVLKIEEDIDKFENIFKENNIKRLDEGICDAYAGTIFFDAVSSMERIGDHSSDIAETVIEGENFL